MSTSALASLTATYTDSEGEEDENEVKNEDEATPKSPSSNSSSQPTSPALVTSIKVTTKVATLVSYHDDTIVSDDEGELDDVPHQVVLMSDTEKKVEEVEAFEEDGITIPAEPSGQCSAELQEKIAKLYEKMQSQNLDMNAVIQKRKDFRNPSIYEKLITFCGLNELGTNYPPAIYDPLKWNKESYYEELAKIQKMEMDRREKERKSKVEFICGSKKQEEESKKRKSKWDMPGAGNVSVKPAGLVPPPTLTTSATGTKSTVISAFGSLPPKKPRL